MDEITFENVRCFHNRQNIPLKLITLLVGENSTGKSTFLELIQLAWQICQGNSPVNFNQAPFQLGTFDQIAHLHLGGPQPADCFVIGATFRVPLAGNQGDNKDAQRATVTATFKSDKSQPKIADWLFEIGGYRIELRSMDDNQKPTISIKTPTDLVKVSDESIATFPLGMLQYVSFLTFMLDKDNPGKSKFKAEGKFSADDIAFLKNLVYRVNQAIGEEPYAFAPIRTRPKRTYDPLTDIPDPEGTHVPMRLAKTQVSDRRGWRALKKMLHVFGTGSGLFTDVSIERLGRNRNPSDPFQIKVAVSGPKINIVDVGYGVSQVLPIIVDSFQKEEGTTFLLQQPEVHLHPRAQAELASYLVSLAKDEKTFIIETHSDYIVDRFRAEIKEKNLLPGDVSILYFERKGDDVQIHVLELDEMGNIVNTPPGYREFFLREEMRFLGA